MHKYLKFLVSPGATLREVMSTIDEGGEGIALVVDEHRRLIGTVTDGDLRRATLSGMSLDAPILDELAQRLRHGHQTAVTASPDVSPLEHLRLMNEHSIRHLPLLDSKGVVVEMATLAELAKQYDLPPRAVIMAGGFGKRLLPLTEAVPKPMLSVGDKPLLERTVDQLRVAGIRKISVLTHYRGDVIQGHFGNGNGFGVDIQYVNEDEPLGTAGGLALLDDATQPLLVINGDILAKVDFKGLYQQHCQSGADLTVGVRPFEYQVPFGVVETGPDGRVGGISEKPVKRCLVNAGVYVLQPSVRAYLERGQKCDMTDLIETLIANDRLVMSYQIEEYWLDIGNRRDYERAQADIKVLSKSVS